MNNASSGDDGKHTETTSAVMAAPHPMSRSFSSDGQKKEWSKRLSLRGIHKTKEVNVFVGGIDCRLCWFDLHCDCTSKVRTPFSLRSFCVCNATHNHSNSAKPSTSTLHPLRARVCHTSSGLTPFVLYLYTCCTDDALSRSARAFCITAAAAKCLSVYVKPQTTQPPP